jgi:O-antigen ligase
MTRTSHRPRRQGVAYVLLALTVIAVAWGALSFGGVYPWAYTPLAIGCAATGLLALVTLRAVGPGLGALFAALAAIALTSALQLVPLPAATFARLNPSGDAFLKTYEISYQMARARDDETSPAEGIPRTHPLSIAPEKTALGLALFAAFGLFLLGTARLVSAQGAAAITRSLVTFGVMLALFGIVQAAIWGDTTAPRKIYGFWLPQYLGTPFGPFVNRNHFAGWVIMVMPLTLAGAYAAWEQTRTDPAAGRGGVAKLSSPAGARVLLLIFATLVMALSLLMTGSRSGMAAFVISMAILTGCVVRRQSTMPARVVTASLVVVIVVGAFAWTGLDRITRRVSSLSGDIGSLGGRTQAWADTIQIVRDFPVTGAGLNAYGPAMMVYQTSELRLHFKEAHNEYLQLAAEGGLLVGIPIVATLAIFVREIRRRFREAPRDGTTYWLRVGSVVGLIAIGLQSLVDFSLQMPGNAALFAVIAAIALHRSPNLVMRTGG